MSILINLLLIGVSLAMDTFSISLSIGTFSISKSKMIAFSLLVGILHFLMPYLGTILGNKFVNYLNLNVNFLLGIILLFIGIEMLLDLIKKEEKNFNFDFISMFLIALSVSLDSFSTGIGISAITSNFILSGTIFSLCAVFFTIGGLLIGKFSSKRLGIYANILGIILLFILGITHIFI